MVFSYNWLQEFFKNKLPVPEKLAHSIMFHVFEVEGIEKRSTDSFLDIAVLPQRGDCLSHRGMAREISAIFHQELLEPETNKLIVQKGTLPKLRVSIQVSRFVPHYSAVILEGVTIGPSPQWMKERLESLGINSINNVVDITNFVMLEFGQPLHAFDFEKIKDQTMVIREAKTGERLTLLDDTDLSMQKGALVIEDARRLSDLAGIKGGKVSQITKDTRHIVFQAATFDPKKIYQTKKALGYTTTAADMYSYGVDPELARKALGRAVFLLLKFGGGKVVQYIDIYKTKKKPVSVSFPKGLEEKVLGIAIPQAETKRILKDLGFAFAGSTVRVPSWRLDVSLPEDLVEEVGRIYGYENIKAEFPEAAIVPPQEDRLVSWQERIKDALQATGFTEVCNYAFVEGTFDPASTARLLQLENPISEEFKYLRPNLLINLLKNVVLNQKVFSQRDIKIFEIGKTFEKISGRIVERTKLGIVFSPASLNESSQRGAFYELKGVFDFLAAQLGIAKVWYNERSQSEKSARIYIAKNREIGEIQLVSFRVLSSFKIVRHLAALEVVVDCLLQNALEEREYEPPSRFPVALRDIALLVPLEVKVKDVLTIIENTGGELVAHTDLFDIYEADSLPKGKKGLAFHIVYQARDRTLNNQEVDALQTRIINALEENSGWEVRE